MSMQMHRFHPNELQHLQVHIVAVPEDGVVLVLPESEYAAPVAELVLLHTLDEHLHLLLSEAHVPAIWFVHQSCKP